MYAMATPQRFIAPLAERVRSNTAGIHAAVARNGASNPRLFGSVARGDERSDSDVDILVNEKPRLSLFTLVALEEELAALLGVKVDVVTDGEIPARARSRIYAEAVAL